MDMQTLMGMADPQQQQPVAGGYSAMQGGELPPELTPKPAASSAEVEQRKAGWMAALEKVTSDPNLMRAVGIFGASTVQPKNPGQSTLGKVGQSYVVGQGAFDAGAYSQNKARLEEREQTRRDVSTGAQVEASRASTAATKAGMPSIVARGKLDTGTVDSRIAVAKTAAEAAAFSLEKDRSEENVVKVERELRTRKLELQKLISDESLLAVEMASIDAAILKAEQARATIASTKAATAGKEVDTAKDQITLDVLREMQRKNPAELKEFLTSSGKYSKSTSGIAQQKDMWGEIFDGISKDIPNDPRVKGKTKQQFQMDMLMSSKSADLTQQFSTLLKAYDTAGKEMPETIFKSFEQAIAASRAGAATGAPGAPAAPGGPARPGAAAGKITAAAWQAGEGTGTEVAGTSMEQTVIDGKTIWRLKKTNAAPAAAPAPAAVPAGTPAPAAPAPAAPAPAPSAAPTPEAPKDTPAAKAVDDLAKKVEAAKVLVASYGVAKKRDDPGGFSKAQQELRTVQQQWEVAQKQYEKELGSTGKSATISRLTP